ncbi:MAG: hypothetical protein LUH42_04035 [Oscillospiraceae bacterium]|nr:hypothetical protein [Oscillospiraceae bacterium]
MLNALFDRVGGVFNMQLMDSPRDMMINVEAGAGVALITSLIDQKSYQDVIFRHFEEPRDAAQCIAWRSDEVDTAVLTLVERIRERLLPA